MLAKGFRIGLIIGFQFIFQSVLACHETTITELSSTANTNGTYTYNLRVCFGAEDTYGFFLDFDIQNGGSVLSYANTINSSVTSNNASASSPASSGFGDIEYGNWDNSGEPLLNTNDLVLNPTGSDVCFDITITLSDPANSVFLGGTELGYAFGPCDGATNLTSCFPENTDYTITITTPNCDGGGASWTIIDDLGNTTSSGSMGDNETVTWSVCACGSIFTLTQPGGTGSPQNDCPGADIIADIYDASGNLIGSVSTDGQTLDVSNGDPNCSNTCAADAGTVSITPAVAGATYLCAETAECVTLTSNGDYLLPPPVIGEESELMYALYNCPPTAGLGPATDPCYSGSLWTGENFNDCNPSTWGFTGSWYFVPITADDGDNAGNPNGVINWDNNNDDCFDLGTPIEVIYLNLITYSASENCDGTVSITVSGGSPEYTSLDYSISNTGGGTMTGTPISHGESLVISGLCNGGAYSILVADPEGCPSTFSGMFSTLNTPTYTEPSDATVASCDFANQGAIDTDFADWVTNQTTAISLGGGCAPAITNDAPVAGPTICAGGTITVTWTITDICITPIAINATYTVTAASAITNNSPAIATVASCDFANQGAIDTDFADWVTNQTSAISLGGGCAPAITNDAPVAGPTICAGGTITVTWTITDVCLTTPTELTATYTVNAAPAVTNNNPADATVASCDFANQGAIDTDFADWVTNQTTAISLGGGCAPAITNDAPVAGPTICAGGTITVTWTITDVCLTTPIELTATYTVNAAPAVTNNNPADATVASCDFANQGAIDTDFADWVTNQTTAISLGGGCAPAITNDAPVAGPTICAGGTITVTWTITDACLTTPTELTATYTVTAAPAVTNNNPADATVASCDFANQGAIDTDFADWVTNQTTAISLGGGCAPAITNDAPVAGPTICAGGNITVTWAITDACLTTPTELTATYIVTSDNIVPTASDPASITVAVGNVPPADPLVVIDEADNCDPNPTVTWLSDVSVIGVCLETITRTYKVMDACDNFTEVEQIIIVEGIPPTITTSDMGVCLGGAIDITASGAGGTGTYSWSPGTELNTTTGATVTSTPTGDISYTVTGTDANGCVNTAISNVTVSGSAPINAGIDVSICTGETTTLTAIGGVTYTWDNSLGAGSTFSVSPTATTTYIVDGVDGSGCAGTDQITVTVNPLPTVAAGVDQIICEGTAVTLSGSGANTYVWDNAVTNNTPFTPGVGQVTYTVIGTDANGCVNTDDVEVTVNTLPTVAAGVDQTICEGPTVTLSGSGANTYVWDNGVDDGIAFIPGVGTITYTVTGTATNGCVNTDDVVVTINPIPNVNAGVDQAECEGTAITLVGSGAMDYVWNNGVIDNTAFTPGVGTVTYIVTGTDGNGCVNTDQVDVVINPNPTPTINGASDYCVGTFATLSTATPYITYFWTTGDVTPTSNVTIADNPISVLVTNAFGCSGVSVDWLVSENAVITYNSTETICQGDAILIHGVSQTVAAVYSETFILGTGCDSVSNVTLVVNPLPTVDTGIDQALCVGGDVTLTATGANTYAWDNSVINGVQFTPSVGTITYTVTGTDINGCENTDAVDVTVNALPIVDAGFDESICLGGNVTLTGSGAITYVWNNGVVENTAFTPTLGTVTYTVTGTDANLCVNTDAVEVTVNALPVVDAGVDQIICDGLMVTLSGSGADTYVWDNGVVDGIAFTPGVGTVTYMVTGTDGNGCIDSDDIIVQFSDLDFNNEVVSSTCGAANGEITLTGTNGIVNYQYSIDNGANFQASGNFIGLLADDYIVVVQDGLGCDATGLISVSNLDGPEINTVNPTPPTCFGESTGSISINATGATGFSIDNGATFQPSNVFLGLEDGTYLIAVENGIGCEAYSTIEIIDPAQLTFTTAPSHLSCNGVCIGEIEVNALGGTGTLQYSNDNGANFSLGNTFTNLCAGDYDMVVQDAIGCLASSIQIVTEPVEMKMTLGITNPLCNSSCDGLINSIPTGGDGNYTYIWSNGVTLPLLLNLCSGAYSLNIEDGNGCSIDTTVTLVGPAAAVITNVIEVDESCPGMLRCVH